jgi:hypothetical protein
MDIKLPGVNFMFMAVALSLDANVSYDPVAFMESVRPGSDFVLADSVIAGLSVPSVSQYFTRWTGGDRAESVLLGTDEVALGDLLGWVDPQLQVLSVAHQVLARVVQVAEASRRTLVWVRVALRQILVERHDVAAAPVDVAQPFARTVIPVTVEVDRRELLVLRAALRVRGHRPPHRLQRGTVWVDGHVAEVVDEIRRLPDDALATFHRQVHTDVAVTPHPDLGRVRRTHARGDPRVALVKVLNPSGDVHQMSVVVHTLLEFGGGDCDVAPHIEAQVAVHDLERQQNALGELDVHVLLPQVEI